MEKRGKCQKTAQVSMEYLLLVGLAMFLIIPSVYLFSERQKAYQSEFISSQVNQMGTSIIDNVKMIHMLGKKSTVILELNFPDSINNMSIMAGRELVFNVHTSEGDSDMVYTCYFCNSVSPSLNGTFDRNDTMPGRKFIKVQACSGFILLQRVVRNETGEFVNATGTNYDCN